MIPAEKLRETERATREQFADDQFGTRVHRSISWIQRAEQEMNDPDAQFIFLWIGFNALYGKVTEDETRERHLFNTLFRDLVGYDTKRLYDAIWAKFTGPIRLLLDNQYVFQPFWRHQEGDPAFADWETRFAKEKEHVTIALKYQDTALILSTLFSRLYVLRNQLLHGSATWQSRVNRSQVEDGARVLAALLPLVVDIMMANHEHDWGAVHYPVVD